MWSSLDTQSGTVWLQQGIFLKGKVATIVNPALIKIWAFYFKDSLMKNSSSVLEVETLHLDVSLVYTSPLSAPANTVQHMTSPSHHKTSVQLDISQASKPGRPATYPVHLQPVPEQGATPLPSQICAFVFPMVLCWVLQPEKVLLNATRFSILWDTRTANANLSSWKRHSFSFQYLFSTVFTVVVISLTPMSNLPPASVFFSTKSYAKTLSSCPGTM